jgi:adenylate cyclase class 2
MSHPTQEIEIKLAVPSVDFIRAKLQDSGFAVSSARVFESNTVFDTDSPTLRPGGTLLRLRQAGPIATLTYKGVAQAGKHKSREELELTVSDHDQMATIFARLGYHPTFRYEKYRTEFRHPDGDGIAMVDETPIGIYLELEGAPEWIDRTARQLGFKESDYVTASYGRLYQQWCEANGVEAADMTFVKSA